MYEYVGNYINSCAPNLRHMLCLVSYEGDFVFSDHPTFMRRVITNTHTHTHTRGSIQSTFIPCCFLMQLNIIFPSTGRHFLPTSTLIFCAFLILFMQAKCPTHLIPLDLITIIILCEEYTLRSRSLCHMLCPPVIPFLTDPNILTGTFLSNTLR
jgi:hypothetical protein